MDITVQVLFLLSLLATLLPTSLGFKCYVCSWSPKDPYNRTDYCSDGRFRASENYVLDCASGCDSYFSWDKNGVLEHARRNCLDSNTPLTGDCASFENKAHSWKRCTCASDLCNSAVTNTSVWLSTLLLLLVVQQIRSHIQ